MKLTPKEKSKVVRCCNEKLISDYNFDIDKHYPVEWFKSLFSFVGNDKLQEHLGDEFFQARFLSCLMETLSLPMGKNKGVVKFQIIQYASICEALLNYAIDTYYKDEFESEFAATVYSEAKDAFSSLTHITHNGHPLYVCRAKKEKAKTAFTSTPVKADYALSKGIISQDIRDEYCALYDLRNNTHILKAAAIDYYPKIKESKDAYILTYRFVNEIKNYFETHIKGMP